MKGYRRSRFMPTSETYCGIHQGGLYENKHSFEQKTLEEYEHYRGSFSAKTAWLELYVESHSGCISRRWHTIQR